jgi:hypothetical protein
MDVAFGQEVNNPWQHLRRGLVLGGEQLYSRVRNLMEKVGQEGEARWSRVEKSEEIWQRVLALIKDEPDERVKIWARVRLGGERGSDMAREYGYRDMSGVTQLVKRLEKAATQDKLLARKLAQLAKASKDRSS